MTTLEKKQAAAAKARAALAAKRAAAKGPPQDVECEHEASWYLHNGTHAVFVGGPGDSIEVYCNGQLMADLNWRIK